MNNEYESIPEAFMRAGSQPRLEVRWRTSTKSLLASSAARVAIPIVMVQQHINQLLIREMDAKNPDPADQSHPVSDGSLRTTPFSFASERCKVLLLAACARLAIQIGMMSHAEFESNISAEHEAAIIEPDMVLLALVVWLLAGVSRDAACFEELSPEDQNRIKELRFDVWRLREYQRIWKGDVM